MKIKMPGVSLVTVPEISGILVVLADGVSVTPHGRWAADLACRKMREATTEANLSIKRSF